MISLSNEKHLKLVLKEIGWRIVTLSFLSTKEINRFRLLHNFGVFLIKMTKNHGEVYTVKFLKACQLAVQKKLAGQPFSSLREIEPDYNFPRLSKSGLPSCIKLLDRSSICNGSPKVIRFYLSLFSLYRIIKVEFKPKLETITAEFEGSLYHVDDFNRWLEFTSKKLLTKFSHFDIKDLTVYRILPIEKSSPQGQRSYSHLITSYTLLKNTHFFPKVVEFLNMTSSRNILILFKNLDYIISKYNLRSIRSHNDYLGALSFKEEAAGKLRVFAMVDIITQSLFQPLHQKLFSLFKRIPNDCTHDQNKGFIYAQELSLKYNCSYGFDLSAATDRLPVSSQAAILNSLFGIGDLWRSILTEREYIIRKNSYSLPEGPVRYSVGQPMGALSSWAMLNLVHHLMIQFIAVHLGKVPHGQWYADYVVLGDDLVLFDKDIADRYLSLCKQLGVSINLSKSIIAKSLPVIEFAKRTSYKGVDVSALPFKELLSQNSFFGRLSISTRLIRNKWGKDLFKLLILSNKRHQSSKVDQIYPLVGFLTQLYQNKIIPLSNVLSLITNRDKPLSFFGRNINWMDPGLISKVVRHYLKEGKFNSNLLPIRERFWSEVNTITFKNILLHKISDFLDRLSVMNLERLRINLSDQMVTSDSLESYYSSLLEQGKSLELEKALCDRWYWSCPSFLPFKKMFFDINYVFNIFYLDRGDTYEDIRHIRLGMTVDLSYGSYIPRGLLMPYLKYQMSFKNLENYYNSKEFIDIRLEDLIDCLDFLTNKVTVLTFFYPKKERDSRALLDNPLKVLDFIKDIHNPKYKVSSDFVKFGNQYLGSDTLVDESPGFKPKFDFGLKPKINIKIM
jgi:hypothetical protein